MKNKYLSRLLAGVLTAGVLQGSGGEENMPELGGNTTPVIRAQSVDELPEELQELFLGLNRTLEEMGYQAQINVNPIQMPNSITRITFNGNSGMLTAGMLHGSDGKENIPEAGDNQTPVAQGTSNLNETLDSAKNAYENGDGARAMVILELAGLDAEAIIEEWESQETRPQRVSANQKNKLDPYSAQIVARYMDTESIKKVQEVNTKYGAEPGSYEIKGHGKLFNNLRKNPSPVTQENYKLYSNIQTQQIFGPNDYIMEDMYQYIIAYPVTRAEIENWVEVLQDKHSGEAIEAGKKPIVFEYQLLSNLWDKSATELQNEVIKETQDFKIKQYYTDAHTEGDCFEKEYYRFPWLDCFKKPIVFEKVKNICVENEFDLFVEKGDHTNFDPEKHIIKEYEIGLWIHSIQTTYSRYKNFIQRYPVIQYPEVEKVSFSGVKIDSKEINEQKRQLRELSEDKKVKKIYIDYNQELNKSPELLGNVKVSNIYSDHVINLQSFGKSRIVIFASSSGIKIPVGIKVYNFHKFKYENDTISEAVKKYVQYVNDNNLGYLSGFVNFAKKPSYLTDAEWRKVMVLAGMVEELMNLVDQKFNEYEADPYAAPAVDPYGCGGNYGCDGYGCAGYNPYGKYYYGYGYGC